MDPRAIAERYFAAIRARNINDLIALYADDATLVLPNGKESKGVAAIEQTRPSLGACFIPTRVSRAV
jgi:ketosteroid isomerase-like protein